MKFKLLTLSLIVTLFYSCSSDTNSCKVTSVKTTTLYYEEITSTVNYNPEFSGKINFDYNGQNQIIRTIGGPSMYSDGNQQNIRYTNDLVNEIQYEGNKVIAQNKYYLDYEPQVIEYTIIDGQLMNRKVIDHSHYVQGQIYITNYEYEYGTDLIYETLNGILFRTFYLTNGNLTKVEQIQYNQAHEITGKIEITMSNFDENENLLKGKYFINGAFYKAFSANNFRAFEKRSYQYINGEFVDGFGFGLGFWFETTLQENGIVDLFEQSCN